MFQQKYLGFVKFKVWEYPFRTKALRQYYQFLRSKYIPAQTTSRQLSDNFKDMYIAPPAAKNQNIYFKTIKLYYLKYNR